MKFRLILIFCLDVMFFSCLKNTIEKPEDFDSFWFDSLTQSEDNIVFNQTVKDSLVNNKNWSLYTLKPRNNIFFSMWVSEPIEGGKFPIKVNFSDFNSIKEQDKIKADFLSEGGFINVIIDIGKEALNQEENINNNFITIGLKNKDSYILKQVFLNSVKAIDYLSKNTKSDGNIVAMGAGFGGTLAVAATALNPKVTICSIVSPFLTDIAHNDKTAWPMNIFIHYCDKADLDYFELMETLSYFDVLSFSNKIDVPILIRSQETDSRTPVNGVLKFYSQIKNSKKLIYIDPCKEFRCVTYSSFSNEIENKFIMNHLVN